MAGKYERWRKTAELLKLSKSACARLEWMIFYEAKAKNNASLTARRFGISTKTFWKWRGRFKEDNLRTLEDQSRVPKTKRQREVTPVEESRIVALRKQHIRYSPIKLAKRYEQEYGEKISAWKIQYVIYDKYKLYYRPEKNRRIQKKRRKALQKKRIYELFKLPLPGFLLQLDTIVIYWNGTKRYILTAIDRHSRIAFAHMYTSPSSAHAADFLKRLWFLWGKNIKNILTDNGSEFAKYFEKACVLLTITHYFSRVKTPKDNAHNERFNRTIQEEFINLGNFTTDADQFNRSLTEWLIEYNFNRPHCSLNLLSPMEFLQRFLRDNPRYQGKKNLSTLTPMYSFYTVA